MLVFAKRIAILMASIVMLYSPGARAEPLLMATGEWTPFTSETMANYGEFTERVSIVLKEMGIEPKYVFYPWRRCFDSVLKGRVWAAFPYSYTKERAEKVWFSDMLSCSRTVFFYYEPYKTVKSDNFKNLEDLKNYRMGGVTGYFYEESFKNSGLNVDYVYKEITAMEKLKMGRIDLMPVNELVGWNLIQAHFPQDIDNFKILVDPLSVKPLCLIVSKSYPNSNQLLKRFNQALKRCIQKGLIKVEKCD